jgi:hypothetical protein
MKYEFHPLTKIFPMMPSHEIDALAADIKKFGQRVPIVIYGGKILDGRNRYEACKRAKVEPRVVQFTKEHPRNTSPVPIYFGGTCPPVTAPRLQRYCRLKATSDALPSLKKMPQMPQLRRVKLRK